MDLSRDRFLETTMQNMNTAGETMDLSRPPRPDAAREPPMRHCEAIRTKTRAATPPWRRNQGSAEKHSGPRVGWCIRWGSLPDGYIRRTEPHRHCRQARNTLQAAAGGSRGPRARVSRGLRPRPPPRAPNAGNHSIQSVGYVAGSNAHQEVPFIRLARVA